MSRKDFEKAVAFTIKWEGGYVNDPDDPGGETKYGITKKSYPDIDIKSLTVDDAKEIYWNDYWLKSGCENLEPKTAVAVFDTAVNTGVGKTLQFLEKASGTDDKKSIFLLNERENFYRNLAMNNSKFKKYLKGWINRINDLRKTLGLTSPKTAPLLLMALTGAILIYAMSRKKSYKRF